MICGTLTAYKKGCRCESCRSAYRVYYKKNRDMLLRSMRKVHLKSRYGLSLEDYEALVTKQNNKCGICSKPPSMTRRVKRLAVDHSHATNSVRGLLCERCNYYLGWYENLAPQINEYLLLTQGYGDDV